MKRAGGAIVVAAAFAAACDAGQRDAGEARAEIEVTGCLTSSGERFVLTELDRGETGTTAASPSTESYTLVGDADALRPHVGTHVTVSGMTETPDVAIMRESSPATTAPGVGTAGSETPDAAAAGGAKPKVSTQEQTRLEVASLRVRGVKPTGKSCTP
jgi:hypothetical protein